MDGREYPSLLRVVFNDPSMTRTLNVWEKARNGVSMPVVLSMRPYTPIFIKTGYKRTFL